MSVVKCVLLFHLLVNHFYKQKQKLYLKNKCFLNETNYKQYKNLFEGIKLKSKQNNVSLLLIKYHNNAKQTWETIKTVTSKQN